MTSWTFLTNHALVLLTIYREREPLLREVADEVGITERAVQRIVSDLVDGGYLRRTRSGRRNLYEVNLQTPLRHPNAKHVPVGALLDILEGNGARRTGAPEGNRRKAARGGTRR